MSIFAALSFPTLPAAACRGQYEIFDRVVDEGRGPAEKAALAICERCPELQRCGDWLDGLPAKQRPFGVTAKQVRRVYRKEAT